MPKTTETVRVLPGDVRRRLDYLVRVVDTPRVADQTFVTVRGEVRDEHGWTVEEVETWPVVSATCPVCHEDRVPGVVTECMAAGRPVPLREVT